MKLLTGGRNRPINSRGDEEEDQQQRVAEREGEKLSAQAGEHKSLHRFLKSESRSCGVVFLNLFVFHPQLKNLQMNIGYDEFYLKKPKQLNDLYPVGVVTS